jgi:acyl-CoA reductase-like NAD-dependent aldehyde dehydrogenase
MNDRELMEAILKKFTEMETQQQEDHAILKSLEHNSSVDKAEHDNMSNTISHIESNLKNIDENIEAVKENLGRHEVVI